MITTATFIWSKITVINLQLQKQQYCEINIYIYFFFYIFSAAITPVFSVTWSFWNAFLVIIYVENNYAA